MPGRMIHGWQSLLQREEVRRIDDSFFRLYLNLKFYLRMKYHVSNGQNIISIVFDGFANGLFIEKPRAINWPDCEGSVGQYYAVSNYPDDKREELTKLLDEVLIALKTGDEVQKLDRLRLMLDAGKIKTDGKNYYL